MMRNFDENRHSALYCPYCGNQVVAGDAVFRLTTDTIIECERCGFEASSLAFSFQQRKKEQK